MTRSRISLAAVLFVVSTALIGLARWLARTSHCAADLKQGFGDIESAMDLEGQALLAFFSGARLLVRA
jgi:hypothetical protein